MMMNSSSVVFLGFFMSVYTHLTSSKAVLVRVLKIKMIRGQCCCYKNWSFCGVLQVLEQGSRSRYGVDNMLGST